MAQQIFGASAQSPREMTADQRNIAARLKGLVRSIKRDRRASDPIKR